MNEAVFDCEADGLNPTKIHCLSIHTTKGPYSTTDYDVMRRILLGADVLIAHNCIRFDIPVLERILGIKIKAKLVDTLALSWYLQPKRARHGLASYGDDFNIFKPEIEDWEGLSIEEYLHRCEEDVRINTHLWNAQWSKLKRIYDTEEEIWKFIKYLSFKMHCAMLQEKSGWKLDIEFTKESLEKLEVLKAEKVDVLASMMPRIPVMVKKSQPKILYKQNGSLSKAGTEWYNILAERGLSPTTLEIDVLKEYKEPNPQSVPQIKDWLFSLGWKPITFKTNKKKKQVPQINLPNNGGICPSIQRLFEKYPDLEVLDGLSVLGHRISILKGFIESVSPEGYVQATIQGLTNTLRFQHAMPCVNLPRPSRPHAEAIRGSLTAPSGYKLIGADQASLEDRLKQHYIFPLDPKYVESMMRDDFDPHVTLAVIAGMMTQEDADLYVWYDHLSDEEKHNVSEDVTVSIKRLKPIRSIAKNGNYA